MSKGALDDDGADIAFPLVWGLSRAAVEGMFNEPGTQRYASSYSESPDKMDGRQAAALCVWGLSVCLWLGERPEAAAAAAVLGSRQPAGAQGRAQRAPPPPGRRDASRRSAAAAAVVPHEYMLSLYKSLAKLEQRGLNGSLVRGRKRANAVTSFVDQGKDESLAESAGQRYLFDISSLLEMDEVVGAELRILRKHAENISLLLSQEGTLHRLLLYTCPSEGEQARLLDARPADVLDGELSEWEVFDVREFVRKQKEKANAEKLLCFRLRVVSGASERPLQPAHVGFGRHQRQPQEKALLVASTHSRRKENLFKEIRAKIKSLGRRRFPDPPDSAQEPHAQRRRRRRRRRRTPMAARAGGRGQGKKARTRCSRKTLHVNFKELGWDDWIIAPLDYEAHHCEGLCDFPLRSHLEPTNHAIIQTLMNSMDPESTPPSCCVPSKLSPISILYIDAGNNVVYKQYEDMVVETCGCR
ncbi:growth/differentiation factor 7 [Rhinatrema bivittatum]|uniref:growth/differentiation factor 7 n=1 Tax=Rhinatrema bivittatum TaxID=194408 RepID=UPI00112E7905|nr:growth/differentiation factor 7 [Rhinatrema bivittatum]